MKYQNKWDERRIASGGLKPFIFLIMEIAALLMICWFVSLFGVLFITVLVSIGAIYFFMSSALPRYNKVKKRQKHPQV
ncbi:MAG: hypothetical protein DRG09_04685 [Epsilonproteobacteria bacterium]|nr:MAG: hypothetical protein DRG09_04685 [Campylobacterota bacterium]